MATRYGICREDGLSSRKFYHIVLLLLLQFLFKFAQGQGPGFNISENQKVGTEVGRITTQPSHTYEFETESLANQYFTLSSNTGVIKTKVIIDRESLNLKDNEFNILILDQGPSSKHAIEISITILDENDNSPVFPEAIVNKTFSEMVTKGSQQYTLTASDLDIGLNAEVKDYKIIAGDGPFELVFNPIFYGDVLVIRSTGPLDRETNSSFTFTIRAKDQGTPQRAGYMTLNIHISDENDNPPLFDPSEYYASVNETDSNGTFVVRVKASDNDIGVNQDITYQIIDNEKEEVSQFTIDPNTGEIFTTREPLFCKDENKCLLNVMSHDGGRPPLTGRAFVYITVLDTNNHDPVIKFIYIPTGNKDFSSVNEDALDGARAAGVQITDEDDGKYGKTTARIASGNELNHFRFETVVVGISYFFVRVNGDGVLDRERQSLYNLTIEASDQGNPPRITRKALIIYVSDINDHAPAFVDTNVALSISETTPVGSFVAGMIAVDLDTGINAKLVYKIESGNDQQWFHIDEETGLITTVKKLHYNIQTYFKMNISVHDSALKPLKDYANLQISIWDENDMTPTFSQSIFEVDLDENLVGGAPVVSASAVDYDSGSNGTILYEFQPYVEILYPNTFHLDKLTGSVTTRRPLDREQIAYYDIKVIAKDQGTNPLSATATVHLKVNDINDNSPVFYPEHYYSKVIEGQVQGIEIIQVTATDLDEGTNAEIIYSISGSDFNKFQMDSNTGSLTTTSVLQKDEQSSYVLSVLARDKFGQKSANATVSVSIISPADPQPYFTSQSYKFSIPEDTNDVSHTGKNVGKVVAKPDNSLPIGYEIVDGDPKKKFSIDHGSGWIRRIQAIDREIFPSFQLKIAATLGDMFAETVVDIEIQDSNDNAPEFEFPVLEIDLVENWPVGHYITIIKATDPDQTGPNSRIAYSLQSNQNNMFEIEANTGILILKKPVKMLGSKTVTLNIVAVDSGTPQHTGNQEIRLTVKDVNNHTPKFVHTNYEISLIESHPVGIFHDAAAVDDDTGLNGKLNYNITRGNDDGKFGIFPDGNLYIAKDLDRETKDLYKLGIIARDSGVTPRSSECNITVHITDHNDNKPIFLNATYSFSIFENKAPGTYVGHIKASDDDIGRNAELSYFFNTNESNFKIDSQTGEVVSLVSFDRELLTKTDYTLMFEVIVKDNGLTRLDDIATIRVVVLDENDNAPEFRKPVYKVSVFENAPILSNITVVKADDLDSGINSVVTYAISHGNEDGNFNIDGTTGQISLYKTLDRESEDHFELVIVGTDSGTSVQHNATTTVKITVKDINDNFPLFAQSHLDINVFEDLEPGSIVAHFPATDTDLGVNGEITYSMSGVDHDKTFGIDRHNGNIYLEKKLDYETKKMYRLNMTATDRGVPPLHSYIRFSITIEDANDNYPIFENEPLTFHVDEQRSGSVADVSAKDKDSGKNGQIEYHIVYQEPTGDHFKIVKQTGQIYIDKPIDREETNMFTLSVVAMDQAEDQAKRLSTETRIIVYIDDTNDNEPAITSFNAVAIPLSTPKNEFVTSITASDKDIGENGRISLQLLQSGSSNFGLESQTGRFYLTRALPSNILKYALKVQANDYGTPTQKSSQAALTVIVTDNTEGPVFQASSYSGSVSENSVVSKSILKVQAISRKNSAVEYYVTNITLSSSGKQVSRIFKVDISSGVLSTAEIIDGDIFDENMFDVEIYAIDSNGNQPRTSMVKAKVQIIDMNDMAPKFYKDFYSVDVDEDVRVDFTVIKVKAHDNDSLSFQFTMDKEQNLKINQDGSIVTTGLLDRETQSSYTIRITATDGKQSSTCMVRINLLDVNDNPPKFTLPFYSYDIDEDTAIGTTVGSVRAHDPDDGFNGQVTYSLSSEWENDTFVLDSFKGTFKLGRVLNFEENQLYTLVVYAKDSGYPVQTGTVIVYFNVIDTNNKAPQFEHGIYISAIYENITTGTSVIQVQAHDSDSGVNGDVRYSITDGDLDNQFIVNPKDGTIYTSEVALDRETTPNYTLTVTASDMAENTDKRNTATVEVSISIMDVNDYTPEVLSHSVVHVLENTALNTVIHTIAVRDLDEGQNSHVEFSISSLSGGFPFTLGTSDGKLRVNGALDRELIQNYTMVVAVTDKGVPALSTTQTLMIKIDDLNDHSPVFSPEYYDKTVLEDVKIGTTLLQVSATDLDSGLNAIVRYFIISGDDNHDFSMDQSSGVIRVQKSLDHERVVQYNLIIQAEDSGDDLRNSTATVSISVQDVNDNIPIFFDSPYIAYVRENMDELPVPVLKVSARDDDSHPYNQLSYSIRDGNKEIFNMSSATGEIMALKKLDREQVSQYVLIVIATDSGTGHSLTGSGTVSVFVEDVNDNPPKFEDVGSYVAHISENSLADSEVIVVKATDEDEGVNAHIIYSLADSINNKFTIFPDTGRITTRVELDREEVGQYMLQVIAKDASMLPQSSTTTVMVYVDDKNDNVPLFDQQSYTRAVRLPAGAGTFVLGVTASDADVGNNSLVTYSLHQDNFTYFSVDTHTGVVTAKQSLTSGKTYNFKVKATDKGLVPKSSSVPVMVTISPSSNISPPTFSPIQPNLVVVENLSLQRTVTTVTAKASISGAAISYNVVGGNTGQAFGIESDTGSIYVKGIVDYEVTHKYHLWIEARQGGVSSVSSFAEVIIGVTDVNDNEPRFSETLYNVSVDENVLFGFKVVTVLATDADSGDNGIVKYSLSGDDKTHFRINTDSGVITTYTDLDREKVDLYNLVVIAVDSSLTSKTSSASVRINILDLNDESPVFTRQFRVKIPENTEVGSFILQVTSSDKDIGENAIATYTLTDDAGGMFMIESNSGNITLRLPLNAEVNSAYRLRVSATDNGAHDVQGNVEIDVSDVNDNDPVLVAPFSFEFAEMEPVGSFVGKLTATDADITSPNNQVYFSLKLASSYFDLDSDTGTITSREELTFDPSPEPSSPNRHELVVITKDLGTPARSSEQTVFVNIVDYNDHAPVFEQSSYRSAVPEVAVEGDSIIQVVARDKLDFGENAVVEYFLTGGNGSELFHIDRFLGKISVASRLVGYRNKEFVINIKAEDKGTPPQSSVIPVNLVVTEINVHKPNFIAPASKQIPIAEDKTVGSLIETFRATDNDNGLNAEVTYKITGGNDDDLFEMDEKTGKLSVKRKLDYERSHEYGLSITARDKGLHYKETTVQYVVKLIDVNDNDPIFAQTDDIIFVAEDTPQSKSVYHAVAVDADTGNNAIISYAIVGDAQAQAKFSIDSQSGVITVGDDLDYETKESYSLIIMALNPGTTHKSTMSLTIYIEGVNEFVPRFEHNAYYFSVSESAETKTPVGTVSASDGDAGEDGIVNYFLIGKSNVKGFKVDPRTGVIYVSGQPDYESSPRITLDVLAKNWGSVKGNDTDTCTVHITVQDANDPPTFTREIYQARVQEKSGADVSITSVVAKDFDVEPTDRQFSYRILAGNAGNLFKINLQTGFIQTTGNGDLDRESVPMYNITVGAVDTGSPPETGSAIVLIHLDDINDNGPSFINFTARVGEGQKAVMLVTSLSQFTRDPDDASLGNQGPYTYAKVPGNHVEYDYFNINENGEVRTKEVLDRESIPEFLVPVIVGDGGSPTMSSTLTFKVSVSDINDTPPTQRFMTLFVALYDGKNPQDRIADVKPLDEDISGRHLCKLQSSITVPFSINSNTCDLMMTDYPTLDSYTLTVIGDDEVYPAVTYDVSVEISAFNNNTLDHSIIVHIAGVTPDIFMNNSYTKFVSSVQSLFNKKDQVFVFGLMSQGTSDNLLLFLAVKQSAQDQYYPSNILKQKLTVSKNTIEKSASIFIIDVAYSTCGTVSVCKNGGECASQVTVSTANQIADSPYLAFSNPALNIESYCICPPQFTGPDCSQPASQCGNTYCQNGGNCVNSGSGNVCQCPDTWTGSSCEQDVDECNKNVCQNEATCENLHGSYICHCRDGFSGTNCQDGFDYCVSSPCQKGDCKNIENGFVCECPYGHWGDTCELTSKGFGDGSFKEFPHVTELNNEIEVIFATQRTNSLLLYNPSSVVNSPQFLALEILNGKVKFSISLGTGDKTTISIDKRVNTGEWFKVKVNRNRDMSKVWVENCPDNGGTCTECQIGSSCYGQGQTSSNGKLEVGTHSLFIGGIKDIKIIEGRRGQISSHDFVGCMRSFFINGQDKLREVPTGEFGILNTCPRSSAADVCDNYTCRNNGICIAKLEPVCHCKERFYGSHCEAELKPFNFGPNMLVKFTPKESARRNEAIASQSGSRRRRAISESSAFVRFRMTTTEGILLFASMDGSNNCALLVKDGKLNFIINQNGAQPISTEIASPTVSDGEWHNATVTVSASEVTLNLDKVHENKSAASAFLFTSLVIVKKLTLGGAETVINIDNKSLKEFNGCISVFKLDGQALPMNGSNSLYDVEIMGDVENGCSSLCANNRCDGGGCTVTGEVVVCAAGGDEDGALSTGIIVVIVFFIVLIIAIIVVFIVLRQRRKLCMKGKKHASQNGNAMSKSVNSSGHSHQDSGYIENNIDELIIRNHIARELAESKFQGHPNGRLRAPDIIESEMSRTPMPLEIEDGTVIIDNASDLTHLRDLNGEMPEHYDLENASSIAPSDIDVVDHYRHFHDGGRQKRKTKNHSNHSHNNSQHSSKHYHGNHSNQSSHNNSHGVRNSPNLLTSVPYMNDLARGSPNARISPINQLSRNSPNVRQSPLTHVNMHSHGMPVTDLNNGSRTTSERSLASHRSKNSSSTPNKPKRQMLPNGNQANSRKISNNNYENKQFLTLEEVDRMNSRPHESPASMMEAFSTSSENNTRKMQKPFESYQDTSVLLEPPESSSDDSANDSFTCSEFEYENDKQRNEFDPNSRIFSNLTEVDNETEESGAYHNRNFKSDGLDSGGNSFSSNIGSSDESHLKMKPTNNAFNWDDLLNWGPKFEKLVGVFTDIALLPDADNVDFTEVEGKMTDREEYV